MTRPTALRPPAKLDRSRAAKTATMGPERPDDWVGVPYFAAGVLGEELLPRASDAGLATIGPRRPRAAAPARQASGFREGQPRGRTTPVKPL